MSNESGAVQWREAIWDVRVIGSAPGGGQCGDPGRGLELPSVQLTYN